MSVAEASRDRVEQRLAALERAYDSFAINQTTLTVGADAYRRARERCDEELVDTYVQVYNDDDDVLLVENGESWTVPHAEPRRTERLETGVRRAVDDQTGVTCEVTDLDRVTILGVRNEEDPDRSPVYRLVAVFVADYRDGAPGDAVAWHSELPDAALPAY
jgi:ADP-ribose pyrophosphatase YjhB (NUDIX family)